MTDNSDLSPDNSSSRIDKHEPGWSSLVAAICLTALQDYWKYVRAGAIRDGKQVPIKHNKVKPVEVKELLTFINSGTFTRVADICGVTAHTEILQARLLEMETDRSHSHFFGSGMGQK